MADDNEEPSARQAPSQAPSQAPIQAASQADLGSAGQSAFRHGEGRKGRWPPGSDAGLVVFDPAGEVVLGDTRSPLAPATFRTEPTAPSRRITVLAMASR